MTDNKREPGYYWVRKTEDQPLEVAEYYEGKGYGAWYISGIPDGFSNNDFIFIDKPENRIKEPEI